MKSNLEVIKKEHFQSNDWKPYPRVFSAPVFNKQQQELGGGAGPTPPPKNPQGGGE